MPISAGCGCHSLYVRCQHAFTLSGRCAALVLVYLTTAGGSRPDKKTFASMIKSDVKMDTFVTLPAISVAGQVDSSRLLPWTSVNQPSGRM
jgi:hypothetical protein